MENENEIKQDYPLLDKQDSIKVSKTSTGKYSFEIKLYFNAEKTDFRAINEQITLIENDLKARFRSD